MKSLSLFVTIGDRELQLEYHGQTIPHQKLCQAFAYNQIQNIIAFELCGIYGTPILEDAMDSRDPDDYLYCYTKEQ